MTTTTTTDCASMDVEEAEEKSELILLNLICNEIYEVKRQQKRFFRCCCFVAFVINIMLTGRACSLTTNVLGVSFNATYIRLGRVFVYVSIRH